MKIALLGATFETGNMGVSALTASGLACLQHAFPDAEISLLDYGGEARTYTSDVGGKRIEVRLVNLRFSKKFYLPNNVALLVLLSFIIRLLSFRGVRRALVARNQWLRQIDETELFAAISGGDSFSDIYGLGRLLYVSLPQILLLLLGKPLVLLPQTLGPYKRSVARMIARFILRRAELVYSRDLQGLETVRTLIGVRKSADKLRFCNDVAFVLASAAPARTEIVGLPECKERAVVGLNVSGLLVIGGYNRKNMFGLAIDYDALIQRVIEFLIETKGASVLLVPHVFGVHEESDSVACERAYLRFQDRFAGRLGFIRGRYNQHEIKYIIGCCDFFIGSRMHACIAAMSQAVPTVAIAYSQKFRGVMETVGMGDIVADARVMSEAEILNIVGSTFEQRDAIRRRLRDVMPAVHDDIIFLIEEGTKRCIRREA